MAYDVMKRQKTNRDWSIGALETDSLPRAHEINAASEELEQKIAGLSRDIEAKGNLPPSFSNQWNDFKAAFVEWFGTKDKRKKWFNSWLRRDEVLNFRRRFNDLLTAFRSLGGSALQAGYTEQQTKKDSDSDKDSPYLKWGLIFGGVVAVGYGIGKITGLVGVVRGPHGS